MELELRVKEAIKLAKENLKNAGIKNMQDAEFILANILNTDTAGLNSIEFMSKKEAKRFVKDIKARCKHCPLDKIIGYTDFLSIRIPFDKNTLSPRQETEILTEKIIKDIKGKKLTVLDLCSGSGCIGIAIAKATPVSVTLSDISKKANKIAKKNAELNGVEVAILTSDLFDNIPTKFDIIVSNPPYIKRRDLEVLEIEVRDFDPRLALDGGDDGLDFYRDIIAKAPEYLNNGGKLYLEIGIEQSKDVVKLLNKDFEDIVVEKDYNGIDRYIIAKKRDKNAK
ncbi:MAG: peptide chain release factor N(5)-glutamine methyltransferase [Clostridiales bacterium]|nr:peptide chain release factor N(5)-glutamine methyltransferase [Clostridiales bacterium]